MFQGKPGDVIGCLVDVDSGHVVFSVNGARTKPAGQAMLDAAKQRNANLVAAVTLDTLQQVAFNFGLEAFAFPPQEDFNTFNACAELPEGNRVVLPRLVHLLTL